MYGTCPCPRGCARVMCQRPCARSCAHHMLHTASISQLPETPNRGSLLGGKASRLLVGGQTAPQTPWSHKMVSVAEAGALMLVRAKPLYIPVAHPPSKQPQLSGRGLVTAMQYEAPSQQRTQNDANVCSSHECVGELGDVKPRSQRACLFRRVCLHANGSFTYHRQTNLSLPPLIFDRR